MLAGYLSNQSVSKIEKDFFKENKSELVRKSLRSRSTKSKRARLILGLCLFAKSSSLAS